MADFSQYGGIRPQRLALAATLPALPADQTLEERVAANNAAREELARSEMVHLASRVRLTDHSIPTHDGASVEARTYQPVETTAPGEAPGPLYIHLHGGGFLFGTLSSEDAICSRIALNTGVQVLNVNYRHSPAAKYPTAWDDAEDALCWVHANAASLGVDPARIVIGGISAGAQITSSLVLRRHLGQGRAKDLPPVAGQVLMIPCLVNIDSYAPQLAKLKDPNLSSYVENKDAPLLPVAMIRLFTKMLITGDADADDLRINPGNASLEQVKGLPPTVFGIAGLDPLRDEALLWAELLTEAK